jgi:hypothetical protein
MLFLLRRARLFLSIAFILFLIIGSTFNFPVNANPISSSSEIVSQIGGPIQGLALQSGYAYLGVGFRIEVLDVRNPASIQEVGASTTFTDFVKGIAVSGSYAFVADGDAGLLILDISDPSQPVLFSSWDSPGSAESIAVAGNYAYLADGPFGLQIIDITDPYHPVKAGSVFQQDQVLGVAVHGSYAYLAAAGAGLLVTDVSTPDLPVEISRLDTPGYAVGVVVVNGLAVVADGWAGLQVISTGHPDHPALIGSYPAAAPAQAVTIVGSTAYVAQGDRGLDIVNLANPASPAPLGQWEFTSGYMIGIGISNTTALLVNRYEGLLAVNVSQPADPQLAGRYRPIPIVSAIQVWQNYAYISGSTYGLQAVDISDPVHPHETGGMSLTGNFNSAGNVAISIDGSYAYLCSGFYLYVADISDPAHPRMVAQSDSVGVCRAMVVSQKKAFIANEFGLQMVDMTDPLHPTLLGFLSLRAGSRNGAAAGIAVSGAYAYIGQEQSGLDVIDVSNPQNLNQVGEYTPSDGFYRGLVISGNLVYIVDHGYGLSVINIANPTAPSEVARLALPGTQENIRLVGNQVFLASGTAGVSVVDITDPAHPALQETIDTPVYASDVEAVGNSLYVADFSGGLVIAELSGTGTGFLATPDQTDLTSELARMQDSAVYSGSISETFTSRPEPRAELLPAASTQNSPAPCVVTSAADAGTGTLRLCLTNVQPGTVVTFSPAVFPLANPPHIYLQSALDPITAGQVTIDASQSDVILDGGQISGYSNGINLTSDGNILRGLQIQNFPGAGLYIAGSNNLIGGDRSIGAGPIGQGNLISGNNNAGIIIVGSTAVQNRVIGNLIGLDMTGEIARPNAQQGIFIYDGTSGNVVGGATPAERNIISGNQGTGVTVQFGAHDSQITGNYVGTDLAGVSAVPNQGGGIAFFSSNGNTARNNLISGNTGDGVQMADWGSIGNTLVGNWIGTDASGAQPLFNQSNAIDLFQGASFNRIGGMDPSDRNILCGQGTGIGIIGPEAMSNLVLGNWIGLDASGTNSCNDFHEGILIMDLSQTTIGGLTPAEANLIFSSGYAAINVTGSGSKLLGNRVGLDANHSAIGKNAGLIVRNVSGNWLVGNTIAQTNTAGIQLDGGEKNDLYRNLLFGNQGGGIQLINNANQLIDPPQVLLSADGISGTTCAFCRVDLFLDSSDQAQFYLENLISDAQGNFEGPKACPLSAPNLTATVTDGNGNSSSLS